MTAFAWPPISSPPGTGGGGGSNVANGSVVGQMLVWNAVSSTWQPASFPNEILTPSSNNAGIKVNTAYGIYAGESTGQNTYLIVEGQQFIGQSTDQVFISAGNLLSLVGTQQVYVSSDDLVVFDSVGVDVLGYFRHSGLTFGMYNADPIVRPTGISTPQEYTDYLRGIGMIDITSEFPTFSQEFDEARTRSIIF